LENWFDVLFTYILHLLKLADINGCGASQLCWMRLVCRSWYPECNTVYCFCYCRCQGEANIGSVEEFGKTVLLTEKRSDSRGNKSGLVVIRVNIDELLSLSWRKFELTALDSYFLNFWGQ